MCYVTASRRARGVNLIERRGHLSWRWGRRSSSVETNRSVGQRMLLEVVDAELCQSVDVKGELVDADERAIKRRFSSYSDAVGVSCRQTFPTLRHVLSAPRCERRRPSVGKSGRCRMSREARSRTLERRTEEEGRRGCRQRGLGASLLRGMTRWGAAEEQMVDRTHCRHARPTKGLEPSWTESDEAVRSVGLLDPQDRYDRRRANGRIRLFLRANGTIVCD